MWKKFCVSVAEYNLLLYSYTETTNFTRHITSDKFKIWIIYNMKELTQTWTLHLKYLKKQDSLYISFFFYFYQN